MVAAFVEAFVYGLGILPFTISYVSIPVLLFSYLGWFKDTPTNFTVQF